MPCVEYEKLSDDRLGEPSAAIQSRAYHRILKLAQTIGGLAGSDRIEAVRLAEAIQYRPRRRS